jgi:hypothetical protein
MVQVKHASRKAWFKQSTLQAKHASSKAKQSKAKQSKAWFKQSAYSFGPGGT